MLTPNSIPKKEPFISVGIVLPEDKFSSIEIQLPSSPEYYLVSDGEQCQVLKPETIVKFNLQDSTIEVIINGEKYGEDRIWKIDPLVKPVPIYNHAGIRVKKVIAGRGFHWEKNIDVFLSGSMEVRIFDSSLIMINEVPIEQYLMCVATAEMGAACPPALIESQTIVARSWMLANVEMKHRALGMDVCNDDCCQRYQGTTNLSDRSIRGALATAGQVLMFGGKICDTRYSKSCGGITEAFENIWNGNVVPYIQPIIDAPEGFSHPSLPLDSEEKVRLWIESSPESFCSPSVVPEKELVKYLGNVDEEGEYFRWKFRYTQKQLTALLNLKLNLDAKNIHRIEPIKRGASGRLVLVKVIFEDGSGSIRERMIKDQYVIRESFHEIFLYSSAFVIDTEGESEIPDVFILKGAGWGHSAGYCQIGALGMSLKGYATEEILNHYYPGAKLNKIY